MIELKDVLLWVDSSEDSDLYKKLSKLEGVNVVDYRTLSIKDGLIIKDCLLVFENYMPTVLFQDLDNDI